MRNVQSVQPAAPTDAPTERDWIFRRDEAVTRAGVERETSDPAEAYTPFPEPEPIPFREDFLPG